MIASFKDSFNKPSKKRELPAEVVDVLNEQLPKGYQYVENPDGNYTIRPINDKSIKKLNVRINYEDNNIPKDIPYSKIAEYAYRTQKKLICTSLELTDGEKTVPFEEANKDPITGKKAYSSTTIELSPCGFPPPIPLSFVTKEKDCIDIMFQRIPYDSMHEVKYNNTSFFVLEIELLIDERTSIKNKGYLKVSVRPSRANTIDEVLLALRIMKGLMDKTLSINGVVFGFELESQTDVDELILAMELWGSFKELQGILGVEFHPSEEYLDDERQFVFELFQSFLHDKEIVYNNPFSHFHIETDNVNRLSELIEKDKLSFSFIEELNERLLGVDIKLYQGAILIGFSLDKIVIDDDKKGAELYISRLNDSSFKYIKRYYLTENNAIEGIKLLYCKYMNSGSTICQ